MAIPLKLMHINKSGEGEVCEKERYDRDSE